MQSSTNSMQRIRWVNGRFVRTADRVAVVTFSSGRYIGVEQKLVSSLQRWSPDVDVLVFHDPAELGSPPHAENPYAFKVYAIQKARSLGYTTILWCDSCLRNVRPLDALLRTIQSVGVYFQKDGFMCGQWANDRALKYFGVSRDDAMQISTIYACCMGFDFKSPIAQSFFDRWKQSCEDGIFVGRWTNTEQTESQDTRCTGHRHDQTCAELVAHALRIPLHPKVYSYDPSDSTRFFTGWEKP